ncbi:long chain fatty acid transporter [Legionella geestiana]|uniref:Long chain fatty acid transporter n=1 Tax=Legionella geestiana TaxID=45065 RepID=A0A0W0TXJ8_9GAMM|nr:long chain fatty acid transporter [Legionella geestiana]STX53485.1 long chain fatty acid transporter [Legionella geestiana]
MKKMRNPVRTLASTAVLAVLANSAAHAGAFSLYTEGSAVAVGNYAAGAAAEAVDASTGWYNPAGLVFLKKEQAVASGVGVFPTSKLTGTTQFSTFISPFLPPLTYTETFRGLNGAKSAFVPAFHYARPLGENAAVGLSIVSPFGLATKWEDDSPVRYAATFSELITTTIAPEVAGKLTENLSLGAGIDLQYARVKFNRVIGSPALMQFFGLPANTLDSLSYNKGDSFGVGMHAGIMGFFNDSHTRIGLNYQSRIQQQFHGYSRLTGRLADADFNILNPLAASPSAVFRSDDLQSNNIEFPDVITLSGYHDVNDKVAVLGSVVYTAWNVFRTIELDNVAAFNSNGVPPARALVNSVSTQDYRNAWRAAIGANYRMNEKALLRVGGGYDQTPTVNAFRDVRLPDSDRWALSIGGHYQARPDVGIDAGYTHLFSVGNARINRTEEIGTTSFYTVDSDINARADLVALQVVWTIDQLPAPTGTK